MMDEDDYLSDKFLSDSAAVQASTKPLTYAERRKQAQREAEIKNAQNRKKSRRQREAEALEEGLKQSLFERAKAEEQELGTQNKAMGMMFKMGFKPGASLGKSESEQARPGPSAVASSSTTGPDSQTEDKPPATQIDLRHRKEPLSIDLWSGKKGVGLGKRAPSPGAAERLSKVAKLTEETDKETYRFRAREEYEERRAEGRLLSATRTLVSSDEKAGIEFNVLSLNPHDPEAFPPELLDAVSDPVTGYGASVTGDKGTESERLRRQMRFDALQPLEAHSPDSAAAGIEQPKEAVKDAILTEKVVEEAKEFLGLNARDRLLRVLGYLRQKHLYCFWCGTQYSDKEDLDNNCPGEDEDAHD